MSRALSSADVFTAVADATRRGILDLLAGGERAVMDLVGAFRISQPAISQHLRVLRDAGLVRIRAVGRQRLYSLEPAQLREVADWIAHYEKFWNQRLDRLGGYLERTRSDPSISPKARTRKKKGGPT